MSNIVFALVLFFVVLSPVIAFIAGIWFILPAICALIMFMLWLAITEDEDE